MATETQGANNAGGAGTGGTGAGGTSSGQDTSSAGAAGDTTLLGAAGDKTGAQGKGAEGTTQAQGEKGKQAEGDFDLKLPEGFKPDEQILKSFKALAKELKATPEQAQKFLGDFYTRQKALEQEAQSAMQQQREQMQKEWLSSIKSDKEIGGAAWDANKLALEKAVERFVSPGLREFLNKTGLGNHPELVRAFVKVGKAMAEDGLGPTRETGGRLSEDDVWKTQIYTNTKFPG